MIVVDLMSIAKLVPNYEADATGGTLWTSTTTYRATVPTGKRWKLLGGGIYRSQSSTVVGEIRTVANKNIMGLTNEGATTGTTSFPTSAYLGPIAAGMYMDAGMYVLLTFGVAQDLNAWASCVVLEFDV